MQFIKKIRERWRFLAVVTAIALGIILNSYAVIEFQRRCSARLSQPPAPSSALQQQETPTAANPIASPPTFKPAEATEPRFGHFPYPEADANSTIAIASYAQKEYQRFEKMAPEAAFALMKMIYAARDEGIWIVPVSGWRSISAQVKLFDAQIQRRGSPEDAAKVSAPPGYSEHHTGYAVDLADGKFPKQDVTYEFANTEAFRWLSDRAKEFGFELSFPENNPQGVSYEPWHWRFVGSPIALKLFARARQE